MSRSSFVEVNITNPTKLAQDSQDTANTAVKGVTDLNDPNLMSVIEKQNNVVQFAGLTSQYNVLVKNAKDEGINTDSLTTAYNNLNKFMIDVLTDPDHASDVDRKTYKNYQDAYNSELAKIQTSLKNNTDGKFTSAASATSQAASMANAAKSAADSTYDYANSEMAVNSMATAKAQSTADNAFSQALAVGSQASAEINSNSTATAKAQSTADNAFSQATTAIDTGKLTSQAVTDLKGGSKLTIAELENGLATKVANSDYASYKVQTASQIAQKVDNGAFSAYQQTTADLIAQKVATSDFSAYQATTAKAISSKVESSDFNTYKTQTANLIDDKVSSSEYASDKTQTASEIADRVSNSAFSTYQTQTASQFAETVKEADFTTYQTQTSKLIEAKVDNGTYQSDKTQTAKDIASKVSSNDFQTYQTQTDKTISSKVSTADYDEQITLINNNINLKVSKGDLIDEINLQAGNTLISSSGQLTLAANTIYFDTNNPVIIPSANIDSLLVGKKLTAADIVANTFSTNNGTFTVDSNGAVVASNLTIRGVTNLVYNAALLGNSGTYPNTMVPGWTMGTMGYFSNSTLHDGVPSIGFNGSTGASTWQQLAQSKLYPLNGLTGQPYSASVWFIDTGSDTTMTYSFTLAFFDSSGNRLPSGNYTGVSVSGTGSAQAWKQLTINGFNSPSTAVYVAIQYWAYNGTGHALFSSPMLTQTAQSTGYQPDTGNVVSAGTVLGSIISGSTINATTFNGGDPINNSNNTSNFYPFTIEPTGKASTTLFNSMDALRTEMSGGGLRTMYRAINASGSQYEAYDGNFSGDAISLNSGFTNGKDTSFSQSVSGNQLTGQVVLSPLNGIHLWGSTQSIHFSGLQMNGTGITFNSYGNIIADQASTWWRVTNFSGSDIANFGTDTSGNNPIQFNRELDIGNIQINTGHTVTSADNQAIHFAKGGGGTVDIYAGAVHYTSLVNSSLLSVKRDVKKADTAYWAQLVNAIDLATYQYKTDDNTSHIRLSGIVDDINETKQWQLPDIFINRDENGKLSGVDNSVLLNAALATIQEQQKQISALNGHNMELESRLNKLEDKLNE